jgi:hypothetical protein
VAWSREPFRDWSLTTCGRVRPCRDCLFNTERPPLCPVQRRTNRETGDRSLDRRVARGTGGTRQNQATRGRDVRTPHWARFLLKHIAFRFTNSRPWVRVFAAVGCGSSGPYPDWVQRWCPRPLGMLWRCRGDRQCNFAWSSGPTQIHTGDLRLSRRHADA